MIVLMFLMFAGFAEGIMDLSTFRYWDNWFLNTLALYGKERWMYVPDEKCCGINKSWENKYKKNTKDGRLVPKFFLSTSLFVIFTDSFHFFKFIQFFSYFWAVYFAINTEIDFTLMYGMLMFASSNAGFYLSYKWIDYVIRNI